MARLVLSPKILDHLDFGTPAAERDIGRGLEKYFVESSAYQRVRSGDKTIVLGNRGAGKSAIFQVLAKTGADRRQPRHRTVPPRITPMSC
jgi:hypothetical protein